LSLDQRGISILNKVIHAPSHVSPAELMEELKVSKRTVYYDVDKVNDWLKENGLESLQYVRSAGFSISDNGKQRVKDKLAHLAGEMNYEFSPKERVAWAAILILTREADIFLQHLLDKLNVSRSTMLTDIKQLKSQLSHFQLELKFHKSSGYFIAGKEQDKRKMLVYFLSQVLTNQGWQELLSEVQLTVHQEKPLKPDLFVQSDIDLIYEIVNESEPITGVRYTDEVMQTLSVHLFLLMKRFNQGKYIFIDPVEKEVIKRTKEYEAARYICHKFESVFNLVVPDDEIFYITTYFLGAKISEYSPTDVENHDLADLKQIITNMVDDFQKFACVFFENRQDLERNLFIHLKPAYFRMKYGIELDNPLAETVQHTYQDLFVLTKKVVHHFEYVLGKPISDDEVAYIAMHFGGWIDKEGYNVEGRKKAVVVCASGIGTSRILQKQIEDLMPKVDVVEVLTVREYEKMDLNGIEFVFSTTPIVKKSVPVFVVNPILNEAEKASLLKQINTSSEPEKPANIEALMRIIRKHADIQNEQELYQELKSYYQVKKEVKREVDQKPMLNELLTVDKIQFVNEVNSWQEALQVACEPLIADESITQDYVEAMIENVNALGPYIVIAPGIALPHARPEAGVNKLGMSFLQLKKPCSFSEKPEHQVTLFFVLAAIDNETHLKALSQLSTMLSDANNLDKLRTAESADVQVIIDQYSQN
jgi:mannitol operon transcriptional antiterminator